MTKEIFFQHVFIHSETHSHNRMKENDNRDETRGDEERKRESVHGELAKKQYSSR